MGGDSIYAQGTTLGGDNGIAIAYALALLEDPDAVHPPLEVLLTADEETDMAGAEGFGPVAAPGTAYGESGFRGGGRVYGQLCRRCHSHHRPAL